VCTQNHDQVGNRALGDRPTTTLSAGQARLAAALLLASPFTPMLFQGDEWGTETPFQYFSSHEDPALAAAVTEGRRQEFAAFDWSPDQVPDPQARSTFERSILQWSDLDEPHHKAQLDWCRELIALRRARPELHDPDLAAIDVHVDPDRRVLTVDRGALRVVANLGTDEQDIPCQPSWSIVTASAPLPDSPSGRLTIPGEAAVILEVRGGPRPMP
ncbi:MAG TPA: DUF3459 domain-containing protein, partial [Acidimicrobiales bacterium]